MTFIDRLNHLRLQALVIYDLGKAQKLDAETLKSTLTPLSTAYEKLIASASMKERIQAIKALEGQMMGHKNFMLHLQTKVDDCQSHIDTLSAAIKNEMDASGSVVAHDGDYTATLVLGKLELR